MSHRSAHRASSPPPPRQEGYSPLGAYIGIGDGRSVALIALDGSIDWWAVPDLHAVPVFGALMDATDGGSVELAPLEPFTVERRYLDGTNVAETVFTTDRGQVRVTDSFNTGACRHPCLVSRRSVSSGSSPPGLVSTAKGPPSITVVPSLPGAAVNENSATARPAHHRGRVLRDHGISLSPQHCQRGAVLVVRSMMVMSTPSAPKGGSIGPRRSVKTR